VFEAVIMKIHICRNFKKNYHRISQIIINLVVNVVRKDVYLLLLMQSFVAIGTSHTHTEM